MAMAVPYAARPTVCGLSPSRATMGPDADQLSPPRPHVAVDAAGIKSPKLDSEVSNGRPLALASLLDPGGNFAPGWLSPHSLSPATPSRAPEAHALALEALATAERGRQECSPSRKESRRVVQLAQVFGDAVPPLRQSMSEGLTACAIQEKPVSALSAMAQELLEQTELLDAAAVTRGREGGSVSGRIRREVSDAAIAEEGCWHSFVSRKRISSVSSSSTWACSPQSQGSPRKFKHSFDVAAGSEPSSPMSSSPQRSTYSSTKSSTCGAYDQPALFNKDTDEAGEDEDEQNSGLDLGGLKKLERLVWLQMKCSQAPEAPSVPAEALSCGTVGHPDSCAVPCKFFATRRGCKDGMACSHCHACQWRSCLRRTHGRSPRRERRSAELSPSSAEAAIHPLGFPAFEEQDATPTGKARGTWGPIGAARTGFGGR